MLLPPDEDEGFQETLAILGDPEFSAAVQQGLEDLARGDLVSHEEVWADLGGGPSG